jgi:ferredoxin
VTGVKVPVVDQDECTGCGLCADIAANTFKLNEDDVSEVIDPQGDDEDTIQEAIDSCPVECIAWEEQ